MAAETLISQLQVALPGVSITSLPAKDDDLTPTIAVDAANIVDVCLALRDTPGLEFVAFSDVTVADFFPRREPRFDVVYHFVSPHRRTRVRVKVQLAAGEPIHSVTSAWPGAGWPERELYDLFGIVFEGHDDLRRLLMPEDWEGHPLRKDYPVQVRKDAATFMPLQVTEEEFRANMERDRAMRPSPEGGAAPPSAPSPHGR